MNALDRLAGTYQPIGWERVRRASDAFWQTLAGAFLAQGITVVMVGWLIPSVWGSSVMNWFVGITSLTALVFAVVEAYSDATGVYVIESAGIQVHRGWPLRSWSISQARVVDARLVKGMFRWALVLSLRPDQEKRLVLSESMRRSMEARLSVSAEHRPTRA